MKIHTLVLGELDTNCYLVEGDDGHAVVIDPAARGEEIARRLEENGLTLDAVLLTHAHFDHLGGLKELCRLTGAPVYLHAADRAIVDVMSRGRMTEDPLPYPAAVEAAGLVFQVLHTPGHSPGSVCLLAGNVLFSGDTLFAGTCGRTDLPGGSEEEMLRSLRRLASLSENYDVLPGHGPPSTLSWEGKTNPCLRGA